MRTPAIIATAVVAAAAILSGGGVAAVAMSHHTAPVAAVKAVPVPTKTIIIHKKKVIRKTIVVPAAPAPQAIPAAPDVSGDGSPGAIAENTVLAYYGDLNAKDFQSAWNLGGSNLNGGTGYDAWVHGYDTTANIDVGDYSWDGANVQTTIVATQTDGSVKTYAGTYTVQNGVIVSANMTQTG